MNGGDGEMTLAFDLAALQALVDPERVFEDARRWSQYVGVVSEKPTYVVTNFTRKHRIRQDFFSGPQGRVESLTSVKEQFDTPRHVLLGTGDEDAALAEEVDWEYLDVTDAAEKAGWDLATDDDREPRATTDSRDDWP
ncbi:hypothetical protein BRD17_09025 [Halobacteriales archaeon SW_7_68_16]|nr:MAG: hypothetical protein BRD17_09025 [Halobacteriales archaeon SW_7_68_16]